MALTQKSLSLSLFPSRSLSLSIDQSNNLSLFIKHTNSLSHTRTQRHTVSRSFHQSKQQPNLIFVACKHAYLCSLQARVKQPVFQFYLLFSFLSYYFSTQHANSECYFLTILSVILYTNLSHHSIY